MFWISLCSLAFMSVLLNLWKYPLNASGKKTPTNRQVCLFRKNIYRSSFMLVLVVFFTTNKKKPGTICCLAYVFKNKFFAKILWTIYYHQLREAFLDYLDWIISFWKQEYFEPKQRLFFLLLNWWNATGNVHNSCVCPDFKILHYWKANVLHLVLSLPLLDTKPDSWSHISLCVLSY